LIHIKPFKIKYGKDKKTKNENGKNIYSFMYPESETNGQKLLVLTHKLQFFYFIIKNILIRNKSPQQYCGLQESKNRGNEYFI